MKGTHAARHPVSFCFITFNNYDNILQRAAKFTGKISDSNLICCLEDSWQNEGYFLVNQLFYLGNTWISGKSPALACLSPTCPGAMGRQGRTALPEEALQGPPSNPHRKPGRWVSQKHRGRGIWEQVSILNRMVR